MKETIDKRPHPGGAKGAMLGLDEVIRRAWAARGDPRVRAWSLQALRRSFFTTLSPSRRSSTP